MSMKKKLVLARKIAMGLIIAANSYTAGVVMAAEPASTATPTGGVGQYGDVTIGNAVVAADGKATLDIKQTSDKAIINWSSFDIGKNATVNFNHMTAAGAMNPAGITLNRVIGEDMSQIYGNINAIGSIILINPNGAYFANGSQVNAAGIIVSTEDMGGEDQKNFKNGTYVWDQSNETNANITIMGSINASTNGKYLTEGDYANHLNNNVLTIKGLQPATGFSYGNNKIMLIADGDVAVGPTGKLMATTTTNVSGDGTVGAESFSVGGDGSSREGSIVLRADQNADDVAMIDGSVSSVVTDNTYNPNHEQFTTTSKGVTVASGDTTRFKTAKVYLKNDSPEQIQGLNVSVYYDSDVTDKGINGTDVGEIGVYSNNSTSPTKFTQKNYTNIGTEVADYKAKVKQTDLTTYSNTAGNAVNLESSGSIKQQTYASLVNNVYQLQAIQDVENLAGTDNETLSTKATGYYGNLGGTYALGASIQAKDTANWVNNASPSDVVGFNPIGNINNLFKGGFTGSGGSNTYGIYDMNIIRSNENNVGLFAGTDGATIWSTSMIDSKIVGNDNVGGIAGYSYNSFFDGVTTRKRYTAADGAETNTTTDNNVSGVNFVGGIIGKSNQTSTRYNTNGATISGTQYVGGLIGYADGNRGNTNDTTLYVSYDGKNRGWYSADENLEKGYKYGVVQGGAYVGGLVGNLENGTITGNKGSYSNGQVTGNDTPVGGLVGASKNSQISNSYNTNEASTLGTTVEKKGDYYDIDNVMGSGSSVYGKVTGTSCVGGLVGESDSSTLDTVYNAGNVQGTYNVGGLVGFVHGGTTINNAYNGDNNTVYLSANDTSEYYGFIYKDSSSGQQYKYTYDQASQTWSSYIYASGAWSSDRDNLSTATVLAEAPESGRLYLNRLAYRDATVTGESKVGGLVGSIFGSGNKITNTYNAGRISGTDKAGSLVGYIGSTAGDVVFDGGTSSTGNFVVTTQNFTGNNVVMGEASLNVVGKTDNTQTYSNSDYEKTLYQASNIDSAVTNGVAWTGSSNQNDNWMVYSNSATPLLKHYMNWININRQYVYDGTVHNLMTTDVDNYYGGAFFSTEGMGKNVYTTGVDTIGTYNGSNWVQMKNSDGITASTTDDTTYSSLYQYDNSNMWSPQHGYYTDAKAGLIITPKKITATLTANKTYGEAAQGYVYKDGDDNYYKYDLGNWVKVDKDSLPTLGGNQVYVLTLTADQLQNKDLTGVLTAVPSSTNTYEANFTGLDSLTNSNYTSALGSNEFRYENSILDDRKVGAGTKTFDNISGSISDSTSDTHNYSVTYKGVLNVNKADLIVNASGSRDYGETNGTSDYTFTAAAHASATTGEDTQNTGKLKSWDYNNSDDISNLISKNGVTDYTLYSNTDAKQNDRNPDKLINKNTWVAQDADGAQASYTLGEGSFKHTDSDGNIVSDLTSSNYNIIFAGNATDEQIKNLGGTEQTRAAYMTSHATNNAYTIKPVTLTYNINGSHTYGDTDIAQVYDVSAVNTSELKNGDTIDSIVTKNRLDELAHNTVIDNNISTDTHVKRDADGNIIAVYEGSISDDDSWNNKLVLNNGSINYKLAANNLTYTVNPAEVTVNMGDVEKTYGDDGFTTVPEAQISGFVKGETQTTAYDASTADSTLKGNVIVQATDHVTYETADGTDLTQATAAAGTYIGAADYSNKNIYFNDYNVVYNKGTVKINPKKIDYVVNDNTKTYGETTPDTAFNGSFDANQLVGSDTVGNLGSDVFGSIGLNRTAGVGSYDIQLNSGSDEAVRNAINNSNYTLGNVVGGKLTVNQREVDWNTNDATREYLTNNPNFSGSFSSENIADKSGILAEDSGKIGKISQGSYTTGTVFTSDAGAYDGDISANSSALQTVLGGNYRLRKNNNGRMTITPADFYYKADTFSYRQGDRQLDVPHFTGRVVNGAGIDVTAYLKDSDREGLNFMSPGISSQSRVGRYAIYGYGVLGGNNYRMALNPQLPENADALDIYSSYDSVYEGAKHHPENVDVRDNGHVEYGHAYVPEEGRNQIRFLTVQESGIHLDIEQLMNNSIVIHRSSRADGGDTVTVERRVSIKNTLDDDNE